jgi:uncharacterized membrane protein YeaQ/YmgE (transglycosylase-associated protein family)
MKRRAQPLRLASIAANPHSRARRFAMVIVRGRSSQPGRSAMSIIGWIVLGLISGFIASRIVNRRGEGCVLNIALGIVGAFVGGGIFTALGGTGVTGFNLYSMLVAIIGAIVVLVLYHAIFGRRVY